MVSPDAPPTRSSSRRDRGEPAAHGARGVAPDRVGDERDGGEDRAEVDHLWPRRRARGAIDELREYGGPESKGHTGIVPARSEETEDVRRRSAFVAPPSRLPGLVASATGYHSTDNPVGLHRGLPSPYLTFIFALDDAPIIGAETPAAALTPAAPRAEVLLGGLHQRPAYVVQPRTQVGLQLAVNPLAARRLFGPPTRELTDLVGDGVAVLGAESARLRERMAEAPTWAERFDLLWDYLRRRMAATERAEAPPAALVEGWRWLARFGGTGSMAGLARHLGYSGRRVSQLFGAELGASPKQVGRLFRFDLARRQIAAEIDRAGTSDLGRVAAERGYYDQSHLVRDFRQYTGTSPTRWIAEEFRNIQAGGHRSPEDSAP